jgi:hypothetical protein
MRELRSALQDRGFKLNAEFPYVETVKGSPPNAHLKNATAASMAIDTNVLSVAIVMPQRSPY